MNLKNPAVVYDVRLPALDREKCQEILRGGSSWVWRMKRAQILLHMDRGKNARLAGEALGVAENTARRVAKRYLKSGLESALMDDPRPGGERLLDERESSEIIAMVCGPPPLGIARWSVRLIAQEAVARGIVPQVGRETIRVLLGSHDLKPWREKKCGLSPSLRPYLSRGWKTSWTSTPSRMILRNLVSAWMNVPYSCTAKSNSQTG